MNARDMTPQMAMQMTAEIPVDYVLLKLVESVAAYQDEVSAKTIRNLLTGLSMATARLIIEQNSLADNITVLEAGARLGEQFANDGVPFGKAVVMKRNRTPEDEE